MGGVPGLSLPWIAVGHAASLRLLCGSLRVVLARARLLDSWDVPWGHVERLVGRDSIRQPSAETIVGIDSQRDA